MPIYEFCCDKCQNKFEELVSSTALESGGVKCPGCGSGKVRQLLSSFSFKSSAGGSASMGKNCAPCTKTSCSGCG